MSEGEPINPEEIVKAIGIICDALGKSGIDRSAGYAAMALLLKNAEIREGLEVTICDIEPRGKDESLN